MTFNDGPDRPIGIPGVDGACFKRQRTLENGSHAVSFIFTTEITNMNADQAKEVMENTAEIHQAIINKIGVLIGAVPFKITKK